MKPKRVRCSEVDSVVEKPSGAIIIRMGDRGYQVTADLVEALLEIAGSCDYFMLGSWLVYRNLDGEFETVVC